MTRYFATVLVTALALSVTGGVRRSSAGRTLADPMDEAERTATELMRLRRSSEAVAYCQRYYKEAIRLQRPVVAWWFQHTAGSAYFLGGKYREALENYMAARDFASSRKMTLQSAVTLSSLSSLFFHISDTTSALAAAEEAYRRLPPNANPGLRSQMLTQLGRVLLIRGEGTRALPLFEEAIQIAFQIGDSNAEAQAYDQMGIELMRAGDISNADTALTRAFALRRLSRDPNLFATKYQLALLRFQQNDLTTARSLIDQIASTRSLDPVQIPEHHIHLLRARILAAQGDLAASLDTYIRAADAADGWRSRGLAADTFRISTDSRLDEVYTGAVNTAVELYLRSGQQKYAVLAWELNERNRSASLRAILLQSRDWIKRVPAEYWTALDELRTLQAQQFSVEDGPAPSNSDAMSRLRMRLAEMEARAGSTDVKENPMPGAGMTPCDQCGISSENFLRGGSLSHFQTVLGKNRTLISFHVGEKKSYRWVISKNRFDLTMLPGRAELRGEVSKLRAGIENNSPDTASVSAKLYSDLFSDIARDASESRWLVSLDDELFEAPVPALVADVRQGRPVYLIEQRAIQLVPGAWAVEPETETATSQTFVGAGDGVYNRADDRYDTSSVSRTWTNFWPAIFTKQTQILELPRLVGSRREIAECARVAGGQAKLLTGANLNRNELQTALMTAPGIVHLAAHFLSEKNADKTTAIALGIRPSSAGGPRLELFTAGDIASLHVPGAMVVMSGCSSANGRIAPAAGLLNLARAWLGAGANAVIAAQWATPDDTGELFSKFYRHLRNSGAGDRLAPAEALRRAQVDMLQSSSWRAEPRYWAAYQIVGRSN